MEKLTVILIVATALVAAVVAIKPISHGPELGYGNDGYGGYGHGGYGGYGSPRGGYGSVPVYKKGFGHGAGVGPAGGYGAPGGYVSPGGYGSDIGYGLYSPRRPFTHY